MLKSTGLSSRDLEGMDAGLVEKLIVANNAWEAAESERLRQELENRKRE